MKCYPMSQSVTCILMVSTLVIGIGVANAQSKKVRPPVVGDGKYYALPDDTVVPRRDQDIGMHC